MRGAARRPLNRNLPPELYHRVVGGFLERSMFRFGFLSLAFAAGFRGAPPLPLDKFDSVIVQGEPCYFKTFDRVAGPPGSKAVQAAPPS
jgi:hypothetical protein